MTRALLTAVLALAAGGAWAQAVDTGPAPAAEPAAPAAAQQSAPSLARIVPVTELGYQNGLSFARMYGDGAFYFPIPSVRAVTAAELVLDLSHGAAAQTDRFLLVTAGERRIASIDLNAQPSPAQITLPVDPSLVGSGYLRIGLTYSAARSDRTCADERSSGDFLDILPTTSLRLSLDPQALTTPAIVAGFQPRRLSLGLPATDLTADTLAAALRASAMFGGAQGLVAYGPSDASGSDWTSARIDLAPAADAGILSLTEGNPPGIAVSGTAPQSGLELLESQWSALAPARTQAVQIDETDPEGPAIGFEQMGFDLSPRPVIGTASVDFPFDIADLPAGKRPAEFSLVLAAAPDPEQGRVVAAVYLNGTLLGSRALPDGTPIRYTVAVPDGLLGRSNNLRVQFIRQPRGGECSTVPQSYPAQVLPGSRMVLTDAPAKADDFFALRQKMKDGLDLSVDPALLAEGTALLDRIGAVTAAVVPGTAAIRPVPNLAEETPRPFLAVSAEPPAGSDPGLRLDLGKLEIRTADGQVMMTGEGLEDLTLVQIVRVGPREGLWIRPGKSGPQHLDPLTPLALDRGDVAVVGEDGVILAASSQRPDLIGFYYQERPGIVEAAARFWPWIVGGLWLALTILVLQVLQKLYRGRRKPDGVQ